MTVAQEDILKILRQIETGEITLAADKDPQEHIKGDILFSASNGWTIEVSNWSGEFSGIVEISTADKTVMDTEFLEKHMPEVDEYFPTAEVAWRAYGMKPIERGFLYLSHKKLSRFENVKAGDVIANPNQDPPWIIVEPELRNVLVARWPGKLWLVQVLERLEPQDHRGSYTRCISVKLIREMDTASLFGPNGNSVETVLAYASELTELQAEQLSAERHSEANDLQSAGWHRWQASLSENASDTSRDMSGVVCAANNQRSPVGYGLSQAHGLARQAAIAAVGDAAIEEDEEESWLVEPWAGAASSLMDAVWAFGAPEFFDTNEREKLLRSWSKRSTENPTLSANDEKGSL